MAKEDRMSSRILCQVTRALMHQARKRLRLAKTLIGKTDLEIQCPAIRALMLWDQPPVSTKRESIKLTRMRCRTQCPAMPARIPWSLNRSERLNSQTVDHRPGSGSRRTTPAQGGTAELPGRVFSVHWSSASCFDFLLYAD